MRKLFGSVFLLGALLVSGFAHAAVTISETDTARIINVKVDGVKFSKTKLNNRSFYRAELEGVGQHAATLYKAGKPELPVVRFLHKGMRPIVTVGGSTKLDSAPKKGLLAPAQISAAKIRGASPKFSFNASAYKTDHFIAKENFTVDRIGSIHGEAVYMITLHPLAYNPVKNDFEFRNEFNITMPKAKVKANSSGQDIFVIVAGQQFKSSTALFNLVNSKSYLGFDVRVFYMGEDVSSPETIRAKLQEVYAEVGNRLKYALMVGDAADVPGKSSSYINGTTDHYYSAIDTNDYDNDILTPDIAVGRFAVSTEADLAAVVDKNIRYETGAFAREAWLKNVSFLATNDRWQVAEGTHNYAIENYTEHKGYTGIFPQENMPGGDRLYAITHRVPNEVVQTALQAGRSIINYSGHGATTYWDAPSVRQADVRAISDDSALPFVISNACITGQYTISESFAETWQRHPYGSIVFWGSMDNTYWDEDDILEKAMYDGIYRDGLQTFGEITMYSLEQHALHYGGAGRSKYYWETYHHFGDPSLRLRTERPSSVTINGMTEAPVGMSQLEYLVKDESGVAVSGANVVIKMMDSNYVQVKTTSADGRVTFDIPTDAAPGQEFIVSAFGQNIKATDHLLRMISPNQPFLNVQSMMVNDRSEMKVGPSEVVEAKIGVKNVGLVDTAGADIRIVSITGPASVDRAVVTIPALAAGEEVDLANDFFKIMVNDDAQTGEQITIKFEWMTSEGVGGETTRYLTIARAALQVLLIDHGNPANPEIGGIRPGDSGTVWLTVKNTGNHSIIDGSFSVNGGACIANTVGQFEIAKLAPGEEMRIAQGVNTAIDAACSNGELAELNLSGMTNGFGMDVPLDSMGSFPVGVISYVEMEVNGIGTAIPDDGAAVESEMHLTANGLITDIGITLDISHTYIGDLTIDLVGPNGVSVRLHDREGGSNDNIRKTFGMGGTVVSDLANFDGTSPNGIWKLVVQDHAGSDTGVLNAIKLVIKGYVD